MTKRKRSSTDQLKRRSMCDQFCQDPHSIVHLSNIAEFLDEKDIMQLLLLSKEWNKQCKLSCFAFAWWPMQHYSPSKHDFVRAVHNVATQEELKSLLPHVWTIQFADSYNLLLPCLPPYLRGLYFGDAFNQSIHNLPSTLTNLKFGIHFNQPIVCLPPCLRWLSFSIYFNQPLICLPDQLQTLKLGYYFNQDLTLPPTLKKLELWADEYNRLLPALPSTLTHLQWGINRPLPTLPLNLKKLVLGGRFNQTLPILPSCLISLSLRHDFNQPLVHPLPRNLEFLDLDTNFNQPLVNLPSSMTSLHLPWNFKNNIIWPPKLLHLWGPADTIPTTLLTYNDKPYHKPVSTNSFAESCANST